MLAFAYALAIGPVPGAMIRPDAQPKGDSPLIITNAGVERAEDQPFVNDSYRFLPGEPVYFSFQIAGFQKTAGSDTQGRKIDLAYKITVEDANAIPLAPPESGKIQEELSAEDKDWSPKRRASFQLPSFVGAGTYHIHVAAHDAIGKTEITSDFPFHIGGAIVQPSETVAVQGFRFYRQEGGSEPLDVAAYQPGDAIYARFRIVSFKKGEENRYHLSYRVNVLRPDGKPFLNDTPDNNLDDKSFYPAPYVPGEIALTTSKDSSKGQYQLSVTVTDLIANVRSEFQTTFTLE